REGMILRVAEPPTHDDAYTPPPEAQLIAYRRVSHHPALSMRQAARLAGISPQSWSNVETGSKFIGSGMKLPHTGTAGMVARMAFVLDISPDDLRGCDREDAAAILTTISTAQPSVRYAETISQAVRLVSAATGLSDRQKQRLQGLIEGLIDE